MKNALSAEQLDRTHEALRGMKEKIRSDARAIIGRLRGIGPNTYPRITIRIEVDIWDPKTLGHAEPKRLLQLKDSVSTDGEP